MLTGSDLLAKVKELGDVSKTDLATACGYVTCEDTAGTGGMAGLNPWLHSTLVS